MKRLISLLVIFSLTYSLAAQHVGIGTTNPAARLHVTDSSVLFSASSSLADTVRQPPGMGLIPSKRMMWYAGRGAFRSGFISITGNWNRDSTGLYSVGIGNNPLALGDHSVSLGSFTQARGEGSVALGANSVAAADYSFASGDRVSATATWATALGLLNQANGSSSFTAGRSNTATGAASVAIGENNTATVNYSTAIGYQLIARYVNGTVLGSNNDTASVPFATKLFEIGNGTNTANRSNALTILGDGKTGIRVNAPVVLLHQDFGNGAANWHKFTAGTATGQTANDGLDIGIDANANAVIKLWENRHLHLYTNNSLRMKIDSSGRTGIGTDEPMARLHVSDSSVLFEAQGLPLAIPGLPPQSGTGRRMMWYADKAAFRAGYVINNYWNKDSVGIYSIAAGFNLKAKGVAAAAFNYQSEALGNYSAAFGNSIAGGTQSFAAGFLTNANGTYSSAFGLQTDANTYSSFVVGKYNDSVVTREPNEISQTPQSPLFIVGNGTAINNRNNALVVTVEGNTGINTSNPSVNLDIKGDIACRQNTVALVNGLNSNVNTGKFSFIKITGPTANFSIDGIHGGSDGKIVTILNQTGNAMTIVDQSTSVSNPANRIVTLEAGANISTVGNGSVTLQYSASDNRWFVIAMKE